MGRGVSNIKDTGRSYRADQSVSFDADLRLEPYTTFFGNSARNLPSMGAFSYTLSILPPSMKIGRYTSIARGLQVMGARHPINRVSSSPVFYNPRLMMDTYATDSGTTVNSIRFDSSVISVTVGNDVWIGQNVTLAQGISIGDGSIVAANATVTKDVPPYTIVGGLPASIIRPRFDVEVADSLHASRWWSYSPDCLSQLSLLEPAQFAKELEKKVGDGSIEPYSPEPLTADKLAQRVG